MLKPIKCIECGAVDLSLFECITHLFFLFFVFFFNKNPPQSRDLSDSCLRDGASKSHQRVHKSRIQIAAAVVKPLFLFYTNGTAKQKGASNQSILISVRHTLCCTAFNNAYYIYNFPPVALCWCAWFIYDVSHLQFILSLLLFPLTLYGFCAVRICSNRLCLENE